MQLQNRISLKFATVNLKSRHDSLSLVRLGTNYGGWFFPIRHLESVQRPVLISCGIGHDVSFDLEMLKHGLHVILVDPLEECCEFAAVALQEYQKRIQVINSGIWTHTGKSTFFPPLEVNSNSWSITNEHCTAPEMGKVFNTVSLSGLLDISKSLVNFDFLMLKLDIEGAERELFSQIIEANEVIDFVGIEIDFLQLLPFWKIKERIQRVRELRSLLKLMQTSGFLLIHTDQFNFFWANIRILNQNNFDESKVR